MGVEVIDNILFFREKGIIGKILLLIGRLLVDRKFIFAVVFAPKIAHIDFHHGIRFDFI